MDTCAIVFQLIHNSDPKRVAPFCATLESTDGTRLRHVRSSTDLLEVWVRGTDC